MEENVNVLPGMSSSYTINEKKQSKRPDLGLLFETKVGPGYKPLAETGSRARKENFKATEMNVKLQLCN